MTRRESRRSLIHPRVLAAAAALPLLAVSCGKKSGGFEVSRTMIQVKGSDTMVNVAQSWAETYRTVDSTVLVEVSGGGSGVGIAALTRGTIDIACASRDIKPAEMEQAARNTGRKPREFIVGYDALAVYVHKDNPLNEITLEQLKQIFVEGGTITNWSRMSVSIPGSDKDEIVRVSRQSSSGTYEFFREHVLDKHDFKLGSRDMNGSKEVVGLIAHTPTAIGYSGMGYATSDVKMLSIVPASGGPAVAPTVANTQSKAYPLARSLQIYTLGEPEGALKKYVEWMMSPEGQKIVEDNGYVPLTTTATENAEPEAGEKTES